MFNITQVTGPCDNSICNSWVCISRAQTQRVPPRRHLDDRACLSGRHKKRIFAKPNSGLLNDAVAPCTISKGACIYMTFKQKGRGSEENNSPHFICRHTEGVGFIESQNLVVVIYGRPPNLSPCRVGVGWLMGWQKCCMQRTNGDADVTRSLHSRREVRRTQTNFFTC